MGSHPSPSTSLLPASGSRFIFYCLVSSSATWNSDFIDCPCCCEARSHSVTLIELELEVFLLQPFKCWVNGRHSQPDLAWL